MAARHAEVAQDTSLKITSCMDCKDHKVISDPDPHDSFCDDDEAVICTLTKKEKGEIKPNSEYEADKQDFKTITVSCRPYNKRRETPIPDWCPKKLKK